MERFFLPWRSPGAIRPSPTLAPAAPTKINLYITYTIGKKVLTSTYSRDYDSKLSFAEHFKEFHNWYLRQPNKKYFRYIFRNGERVWFREQIQYFEIRISE
jgi:hypothetical protein